LVPHAGPPQPDDSWQPAAPPPVGARALGREPSVVAFREPQGGPEHLQLPFTTEISRAEPSESGKCLLTAGVPPWPTTLSVLPLGRLLLPTRQQSADCRLCRIEPSRAARSRPHAAAPLLWPIRRLRPRRERGASHSRKGGAVPRAEQVNHAAGELSPQEWSAGRSERFRYYLVYASRSERARRGQRATRYDAMDLYVSAVGPPGHVGGPAINHTSRKNSQDAKRGWWCSRQSRCCVYIQWPRGWLEAGTRT